MTAKFKQKTDEEESKEPSKPVMGFGALLSMAKPKQGEGASDVPTNPLFAKM
jgi:hypothetical protein